MAREVGDKVGPRIAELIANYNMAVRGRLASVEARIHQTASQALIDRAGREISDLYKPITGRALADKAGQLHPLMEQHLRSLHTGNRQWESIMGHLQMGAVSAISATLSNVLFPVLGEVNLLDRSTPVDPQTAAAAYVAGLVPYGPADTTAGAYGTTPDAFAIMAELAVTYPGLAELLDLLNRGLVPEADVRTYLHRSGLKPALIDPLIATRWQLLSPADIALGLLRGDITQAEGDQLAAEQGISKLTLARLVYNTGEPPGIEQMVSLWKRGLIPEQRLDRAILQSRVRDEWIPDVKLLAIAPPTQDEVLQALVQGEVDQAEALKRFEQAGGDPSWFEQAYRTRANAPSPNQAAEMALRGIIPWDGRGGNVVSFAQAFVEGRWKNKYEAAFRRLSEYLPPPREVTTLAREGAITEAQAQRLWEMHGLTPELAHVYWESAHYARTGALHQLAAATIEKLYLDKAITEQQAMAMLQQARWTKTDAQWLLDLADMQREIAARNSAISKIRGLYIAYKIDKNQAGQALGELGILPAERDQLLRTWDLERADNLKTLTAAEVLDAWYYQLVPVTEAQQMLERMGYTAYDAWLLLNIKNKQPIQGFPRPA